LEDEHDQNDTQGEWVAHDAGNPSGDSRLAYFSVEQVSCDYSSDESTHRASERQVYDA
jgi:hypothetical protein